MEIKKPAAAGTLESSDCMVTVEPGENGIELDLESAVIRQYGRQIRKVTKDKGVFPSDKALEKLVYLVYLVYRNISEKWTMPLANWVLISQQLAIKFRDRFKSCKFAPKGSLGGCP